MNRTMIVSVVMLAMSLGRPCLANKHQAPLDPKIVAAKSVFIEGLGSSKLADIAYNELKKWKRWEIVGERLNADLVLVLSPGESPSSSGGGQASDPNSHAGPAAKSGSVHVELFDANRRASIYTDTEKTMQEIILKLAKRIEKEEK